jgi:HEAT repeats
MINQHTREMLQLYLYDELSAEDKRAVEDMLRDSEECRAELDQLKRLHTVLAQYKPAPVSDEELGAARAELRMTIRHEQTRVSWTRKISDFVADSVFVQYKYALGSVAAVAVGFLVGYAVFSTPARDNSSLFQQASNESAVNPGQTQIVNVHFLNQDVERGKIDLTFDAVTPMHIEGNVNDPRITAILAKALVNERNPGVRLKTVSAISDRGRIQPSVEREVKTSLIAVLKYDKNPGVRQEALKALQKFPVDDDIVEAILYVLKNESNTGLRIAAINFLDFSKLSGQSIDKDLLNTLKERMQSDDNNYIRIRGNAAFQEIKQ